MFMNLIRQAYIEQDWELVDRACLELFGKSIKDTTPVQTPPKAKTRPKAKKKEVVEEFYEIPQPTAPVVQKDDFVMQIKGPQTLETADGEAKIPCIAQPLDIKKNKINTFDPSDYGVPKDKAPEIIKPPVARLRPKFEEVLARCVSCQSKSMVHPMLAKHYRCSSCCKG